MSFQTLAIRVSELVGGRRGDFCELKCRAPRSDLLYFDGITVANNKAADEGEMLSYIAPTLVTASHKLEHSPNSIDIHIWWHFPQIGLHPTLISRAAEQFKRVAWPLYHCRHIEVNKG